MPFIDQAWAVAAGTDPMMLVEAKEMFAVMRRSLTEAVKNLSREVNAEHPAERKLAWSGANPGSAR